MNSKWEDSPWPPLTRPRSSRTGVQSRSQQAPVRAISLVTPSKKDCSKVSGRQTATIQYTPAGLERPAGRPWVHAGEKVPRLPQRRAAGGGPAVPARQVWPALTHTKDAKETRRPTSTSHRRRQVKFPNPRITAPSPCGPSPRV